jgi:hypothetical protein
MNILLNMGTWLGWGSKVTDAVQGKVNVAGEAKDLFSRHFVTSQPELTATRLAKLVKDYDANPPNSITSTAGTSVYYVPIAMTIITKAVYTAIRGGRFDKYATQLGDLANTKYLLPDINDDAVSIDENSPGAKLLVFMVSKMRKDATRLNIDKLMGIVGGGAVTYTDNVQSKLEEFIDKQFFGPNVLATKTVYQKFKKTKQLGGKHTYSRRKGLHRTTTRRKK